MRFLLLLICSACGLLAVGVHVWLTGAEFWRQFSPGSGSDPDFLFMTYFFENWMIFYGVIYGLGRVLAKRFLKPQDLAEMDAERRWYYPALLTLSGWITAAANIDALSKERWVGWLHWAYVAAGSALVVWGLCGLWSWWQDRRKRHADHP